MLTHLAVTGGIIVAAHVTGIVALLVAFRVSWNRSAVTARSSSR